MYLKSNIWKLLNIEMLLNSCKHKIMIDPMKVKKNDKYNGDVSYRVFLEERNKKAFSFMAFH